MMHPYERERSSRWQLPAPAGPLIAGALVGLVGIVFGVSSINRADRMTRAQNAANSAMVEMQKQLHALNERLSQQEARERETAAALSAAQNAAAQRAQSNRETRSNTAERSRTSSRTAVRKPADDPRILQLERKFSDHDAQLASTQRMVESTRTDLENKLAAKSDELGGSIARTSEEVAALRRRGERDYFEFDLVKSKQVQRVGPVSLGLRKADTKRKRYDLDMIVDDNRLEKKNVNLLEPLYLTVPDKAQPLEVVVNRLDKDRVSGYVSVPKYKRSELTAEEAGRSALTPRSAPVPK